MNKKELVKKVSFKTGLNISIVNSIFNSLVSQIVESVSSGDEISLRGFGSFVAKNISARSFVSVNNNQVESVGHKKPNFKPSKEFVSRLNYMRDEKSRRN